MLTQAAIEVAAAMPTWPKRKKSANAPTTLTTIETPPYHIGVRVSSRAKKAGCSTLMATKAGRPERVGGERRGGRRGVGGGEGAALEEDRDDRAGNDEEGDRRRQGQRGGELDRPVLGVRGFGLAAGAERPRQIGEEDDADGDADDAERQLVEAVGVVEPRHRAGLERGDDRADDDVDLGDAAGNDARPGESRQAPDAIGASAAGAASAQSRRGWQAT